MKSIIIGITTFLLCHSINAQNFHLNYKFDNTCFHTEELKFKDNLSINRLSDKKLFSNKSSLNYSLIGVASSTPYILAAFSGNNSSWNDGLRVSMKTRTFISAGLFIPTIISGYSMRGSDGNPNDGLLAVHKLSTVSNLVLLDATVLKKRKVTSLSWLESFLAITMNVSFVATITTGGLQSVDRTMPGWVNTSHQITPWITVLSSGALLYLLNK